MAYLSYYQNPILEHINSFKVRFLPNTSDIMTGSLETRINEDAVLLNIGTHRQENKWSCGPSALKIVLDSFGNKLTENELIELAKADPKNGTQPEFLCTAAQSLGYRTFQKTNASIADIEMFLKAGLPVIITYQGFGKSDGYKEGHYTVIYGASKTHLYRSDPSANAGYMRPLKRDVFFKRWHDKDFEKRKYEQWMMVVFPNPTKFVRAEGSNYEIGLAIGEQCKEDINKMLKHIKDDYQYRTKKDFSTLIEASKKFLKHSKAAYPEYVRELQGMAKGAEIDFNELFTLSCTEELDWSSQNPLLEKCTSIVAKVDSQIILAHNEDYGAYPCNALYILKAKQKGKPEFLSVGYTGTLAGSSAGLNSAGIAMSGNSICAPDSRFGVLKNFICRKVLDETSVDSAVRHIEKTRRAGGGNYNLVTAQKSVFVETFAKECSIIELEIPFGVHTNHCIADELSGREDYISQSSKKRFKRLNKIFKNIKGCELSPNELKELLSNHDDWPISICRHDYESDAKKRNPSSTLGSIILNPAKQTLEFASGNPCRTEYKTYRL